MLTVSRQRILFFLLEDAIYDIAGGGIVLRTTILNLCGVSREMRLQTVDVIVAARREMSSVDVITRLGFHPHQVHMLRLLAGTLQYNQNRASGVTIVIPKFSMAHEGEPAP